ncbi:hypothetical protein STAQ_08810 [Allostella sp. ATCC 35155]|nr:hypothetical protein STAQ_08810 [Stella sp. ATCC 35155]
MASERLAVLARPHGRADALRAIDRVRRRFDPRHGAVPAHVTLVFPTAAPRADARRHVLGAVLGGAVRCRLGAAELLRTGPRGWYVLLPVDQGAAAVARLHHALSRPPLAGNRLGTAPFRPHLTVAAGLDLASARRVRRLARPSRGAVLTLTEIELVAWDGRRLRHLAQRALGRGGPQPGRPQPGRKTGGRFSCQALTPSAASSDWMLSE